MRRWSGPTGWRPAARRLREPGTMSDAYERGGFRESLDTGWSARWTLLPVADRRRRLLSTCSRRLLGHGFCPRSACAASSSGRISDTSGHQPPAARPPQR